MDARSAHRFATMWFAELHVGNDVLFGRVRDITAGGAFFHPETSLVHDDFYGWTSGDDAAAPDEEVVLRLLHGGSPDVEIRGRVCWTGHSGQHGCAGLGIAFAEQPRVLSAAA